MRQLSGYIYDDGCINIHEIKDGDERLLYSNGKRLERPPYRHMFKEGYAYAEIAADPDREDAIRDLIESMLKLWKKKAKKAKAKKRKKTKR